MPVNSFTILEREWAEFDLGAGDRAEDFMRGRDISWVAQVSPIIEELTEPGQLIFDPFAGLGTTLLGAGLVGRRSIGFEVDAVRFELLQKRLERHRAALSHFPEARLKDALTDPFPEGLEAIITNPPYYHAGQQKRSGNIYGTDAYAAYLEQMDLVISKCAQALPQGGKLIVFSENINKNNIMIPQAYDICKIMEKHCRLQDERLILYVKLIDQGSAGELRTNRAHEYVFIGLKL
jgi:Predicted DNA modification methylase